MAVKQEQGVSYEEIVKAARAKKFAPVYYLMGEEAYYIDRISDYIVEMALTEEERDFNLNVVYGNDVTMVQVMDLARRYPMMSDRQVVLVKDAQNIANKDVLEEYLRQPLASTVLIFCHRNGVLDRRKKLTQELQKRGVLFESKKLYDSQLPSFVSGYAKRRGVQVEPEAALLLSDFVGSDLNRLAGEIDKVILGLGKEARIITPADVERYVGVSKDFNSFELLTALIERDSYKAMRIVNYFDSMPKSYSLQKTLAVLFNFFSSLMQAYYAPQKTDEGLAAWLELPRWQITKNFLPAMKTYTGMKVMQIIAEIRKADARSKGVESTANLSDGDILKELIFFILH